MLIKIAVDDREQRPLLFPDRLVFWRTGKSPLVCPVQVKKKRLDSGDYRIQFGATKVVGVERKGGMAELRNNMTSAKARWTKAWVKFQDTYPVHMLFMDTTPLHLMSDETVLWDGERRVWMPGMGPTREQILDAFFGMVAGCPIVFGTATSPKVNQRRKLGEMVLRYAYQLAMRTPQ